MSDSGVGNAILLTRVKLTAQAASTCFTFGAFPCFVAPFLLWYHLTNIQDIDVVRLHLLADVVSPDTPRRWRFSDSEGVRKVITIDLADGTPSQWMRPAVALMAVEPLDGAMDTFRSVSLSSLLTAALGFLTPWFLIKRFGNRSQQDRRVRGAKDIVSATDLAKLVRAKNPGPYTFVDVVIPRDAPMRGLLALGAPGGGKSMAIHDLILQVRANKRKRIVYDQSGEFFRAHFRPGKDVFFNPACVGSVPWSIFSELKYSYDADTLAHAFLPKKSGVASGAGAFFEDAARALFSVLLRRLAEVGAQNTSDLAAAFLALPEAEMDFLIKGTIASSSIGGDSKAQRQGVISSIAIYLNGIATVQAGNWSIREFIDSPGDACLYILGSKDTRAMYAPLFRLLLTIAFETIAAREEHVHEDRYWFFLDEVHTLGDIKLDEQLTTLRKYGVCVVSGIQSDSQFNESMGQDRGAVVMNCFSSVLMLAAYEENMQKRMSARLGMVDVDVVSRNQALAVTESRDGAGLTRMDKEKALVMPAHFGELDACHGYLKLSGSFPAADVDYSDWLKGSFWNPRRVDRWKARIEMPPKDPRFEIIRVHTEDVIASITIGMKAAQAASSVDAGEAGTDRTKSPAARRTGLQDAARRVADPGGTSAPMSESRPHSEGVPDSPSAAGKGDPPAGFGRATRISLVPSSDPKPIAAEPPTVDGGRELAPGIIPDAAAFPTLAQQEARPSPRAPDDRAQKELEQRVASTPPLLPPLDPGSTRQLDM